MTPAELARVRKLHAAMVDGSARSEDVAELVRLLPAVFEAAEPPTAEQLAKESMSSALDCNCPCSRRGYASGARREGRR